MHDLTLLEPHETELRAILDPTKGVESAAYVVFGVSEIASDPWSGVQRTRLISHRVVPIPDEDLVSASSLHVTWSTRSFVRELREAAKQGFILGIAHNHLNAPPIFSVQDDQNERDLAKAVMNSEGEEGRLVSILAGDDGAWAGRVWRNGQYSDVHRLSTVGKRLRFHGSFGVDGDTRILDRQARIFGKDFNRVVRGLRVAVVGCGGTGSPLTMLLLRLGVGHILLIDNDVVDETNLNRIHGARYSDVGKPKVDVLAREIREADLGVSVVPRKNWVGDAVVRDALKSCDIVFGCTDDHDGRMLLNRLSYFYGIPYLDVGLRISPRQSSGDEFRIVARLSSIIPGKACMLCRNIVDPKKAQEEHLQRVDREEFQRQKAEAYVEGNGDPSPAVVSFTTEAACMAVNELIQALTSFRGDDGMATGRFRMFESQEDKVVGAPIRNGCSVCSRTDYWGRGDVEPFLDRVG